MEGAFSAQDIFGSPMVVQQLGQQQTQNMTVAQPVQNDGPATSHICDCQEEKKRKMYHSYRRHTLIQGMQIFLYALMIIYFLGVLNNNSK